MMESIQAPVHGELCGTQITKTGCLVHLTLEQNRDSVVAQIVVLILGGIR